MITGGKINSENATLWVARVTIVVVGALIILKSWGYYESGSAGVLSSLIDSVMDAVVSFVAFLSVFYAARPADEDHRWGHGKMEAVSALFQSAVIAGGGAFLVFEATNRVVSPQAVSPEPVVLWIMAVSVVLSAGLVMFQRYAIQHTSSLAIEADSAHYGGDILINAGVFLVLLAQHYGAPTLIDPLFALGVAVYMAYVARGIAGKAMGVLLDREAPEEQRAQMIAVIEAHTGVIGWHDLRTRCIGGPAYSVSFDIEVDAGLSLWAAHDIAKDLEAGILAHYPAAEILIHIDPEGYTHDTRHRVQGVHL